ncbi:MAG: glycosyltransferase family 2 protein [Puniceicoccales bacterium]|jgi:glycosyltransferase involved in cell wall biosynthesis|nr:glycosyltransferase family 2 protein [Puniceicoccales bacterium]
MDAKVVVGLCTFNRHEQLKEAMDSLSRVTVPALAAVEFVLVDNDESGGAKYIFDAYAPDMPFGCHYFIEKNRGLAHVRNRIVEEALALGATEIAMFDDDEIVVDWWLTELCEAYKQSGADGVVGTVYRLLPIESSELVKKFWTGCKLDGNFVPYLMGTNNCLFSTRLVRRDGMNLRFDNSFNFSGREDLVLSFDALKKGAKFATAPEAIVIEKFTKERSTFGYLFGRWFDNGLSDVKVAKHYGFGIAGRTAREILAIFLKFCIALPLAIFHRKKCVAMALQIASSCGWICGLFGKSADYYMKHGG